MNNRFSNYGLWISLFALLGMVLLDTNTLTDLGRFDQYIKIILGILIALGVISSPTQGTGYSDK